MKPVIGLDFGNFNTFASFISNFEKGTKMGGIVHDLLPSGSTLKDGIPSVYFYSKKRGVLLGENALRTIANPPENRLRYLKRNLGKTIILDGKTISYDKAITEVIQHCIRIANKELLNGYRMSTNLISLSYPASYTFAQRQRLIELAEKATLEDGTSVEVYGTIAEPAAAALDYLAEFINSDKDTTVLVYDLGGGTFDLGLVSVYPKGRINTEGHTYYYDIINTRGISKLGGAEFDEIIYNLLLNKLKENDLEFFDPVSDLKSNKLNLNEKANLKHSAEEIKIELSTLEESVHSSYIGGDYIEITITRQEFEDASRELFMKTIKATKGILDEHKNQKPEMIILVGGASQMPMVKKEMEKEFKEYKGKIFYFRPNKSISYGAARFGTSEKNSDPTEVGTKKGIVQQRVMYDIGVRYFEKTNGKYFYISKFIEAGTPVPYSMKRTVFSRKGNTDIEFSVYEAKVFNPDNEQIERDYKEIMSVTIDHGREVPIGHPHEARMSVDENGILTIEVRDISIPNLPYKKASVQLKNLS